MRATAWTIVTGTTTPTTAWTTSAAAGATSATGTTAAAAWTTSASAAAAASAAGAREAAATGTGGSSGGTAHALIIHTHRHVGESQRERCRTACREGEAHASGPALACRTWAFVLQAVAFDAVATGV